MVAAQLMARDALGAHARDELDISGTARARPVQAALVSAASFTVGAGERLLAVLVARAATIMPAVSIVALAVLAVLGAIGARTSNVIVWRGTLRVTFWGAFAVAATAMIGHFIGSSV